MLIGRIYKLFDTSKPDEVRYIGKTTATLKRRLAGHISDAKNNAYGGHHTYWIRKVLSEGNDIGINIVETVELETPRDLNAYECFYIKMFRELGCRLTNSTEGGEGTYGYVQSEEHRRKNSEANKGHIVTAETRALISEARMGHEVSKESRDKTSASLSGENHPMWGKECPEETKAKISKANTGRKMTDEQRKHVSEGHTGLKRPYKKASQKQIEANSEGHKGLKYPNRKRLSEEDKKKMSDAKKGKKHTEEHNRKISESLAKTAQRKREERAANFAAM